MAESAYSAFTDMAYGGLRDFDLKIEEFSQGGPILIEVDRTIFMDRSGNSDLGREVGVKIPFRTVYDPARNCFERPPQRNFPLPSDILREFRLNNDEFYEGTQKHNHIHMELAMRLVYDFLMSKAKKKYPNRKFE